MIISTLCKILGYCHAVTEVSGVLGWGMLCCWMNRTFGWCCSRSKCMELLAQQYRGTSQRTSLHILHPFDSTSATYHIKYIHHILPYQGSHTPGGRCIPHTGLVLCGDHPVIYLSVDIKLDFFIRVQAILSVSIIIQH